MVPKCPLVVVKGPDQVPFVSATPNESKRLKSVVGTSTFSQ